MIKLENLTQEQQEILSKCLEGKTIEEIGFSKAMINSIEYKRDEEYLNLEGAKVQLINDFLEVERYINSFSDDYEVRKNNLLKNSEDYYKALNLHKKINDNDGKSEEEVAGIMVPMEDDVIKVLGVQYGFTDKEVCEFIKDKLLY
jgi:hypothetical protein